MSMGMMPGPGLGIGATGGDPNWSSRFFLLHFDGANGSTTFTDQVAGNSWTPTNATISTTQSKFGGASGKFQASTTYIVSGRPASDFAFLHNGTTLWTLEAWLYPTASGAQYFADTGGAATSLVGFTAGINASGLFDVLISRGTSGAYAARCTGGSVPLNTWTYVKAVFDGTNLKTFVGGAAAASSVVSSPYAYAPNNTFNFGRYANGNSLYYTGYLDEVRLTQGIADTSLTVPTAAFPDHA